MRLLKRQWMVMGLWARITPLAAQAAEQKAEVPVAEFTLDNGMKFLVVPRPEQATVMGGWVAKVGSANERPGITGVAHFFEHMMFKGSRVDRHHGHRSATRRSSAEQEKLQEKIRAESTRQQRGAGGKARSTIRSIPRTATPELEELEARFQTLVEEQRALMVKDEFDKIYTEAGRVGHERDHQLGLDHLLHHRAGQQARALVLDGVGAARCSRSSASSTPSATSSRRSAACASSRPRPGASTSSSTRCSGPSHPYKWDAIGWMSRPQDAVDGRRPGLLLRPTTRPNNLTAALVGNFDPAEVKAAGREVLRPHSARRRPVPDVVTLEEPQLAEKRMNAECDCQPQVSVQFHTVPFEHRDQLRARRASQACSTARPGGSSKSLVLDRQIAVLGRAPASSRCKLERLVRPRGGDQGRRDAGRARGGALARSSSGCRTSRCRPTSSQKVKNQIVADVVPPAREPVLPAAAAAVLRRLGRLEVPERVGRRRRSR